MRVLSLIILATLIGCNGPTYKLEDKWLPLEQVQQTTDKLIADHTTTTIGETCFCNDLKQWLQDYPPGSVEYEALLMHERVHSVRQGSFAGRAEAWLALYAVDTDFRWKEEKLGWKEEITHLVRNLRYVSPEEIATWLNQNYSGPVGGRMVSYEDALVWVRSVIAQAEQTPKTTRKIRPH